MSSAAKPPILTVISKILESSNLVGTSEKKPYEQFAHTVFLYVEDLFVYNSSDMIYRSREE